MGGTVRVAVLGPVEVAHGERLVAVPGPRLRCVLAVPASEAGRVVPAALPAGPGVALVDPDEVDLHRFREIAARARAGADVAVRRRLPAAAAEWRGAPLADTADGPLRDRLVSRWWRSGRPRWRTGWRRTWSWAATTMPVCAEAVRSNDPGPWR
ncbi:hypothetical protein ACIQMJ_18370 [Actinosynnema sp. NPDC091369]